MFLILKSPGKFNKLLLGNIYRNPHSTLDNDKQLYALFDHIDQNFKIPKLIVGDFNFSNIEWYSVHGSGASPFCSPLNDNELAFGSFHLKWAKLPKLFRLTIYNLYENLMVCL